MNHMSQAQLELERGAPMATFRLRPSPHATGVAANANAIAAIAYRDFLKLLRDPARIVSTFIFPLVFIGILGGSLQANLGESIGFNLLVFTFTGVLAQTVYQSTALGMISL